LVTLLVAAAFLVKAVMIEILIARTTLLRNLYTNRLRANQVIEASFWILEILTPDIEDNPEDEDNWKLRYMAQLSFITRDRKLWSGYCFVIHQVNLWFHGYMILRRAMMVKKKTRNTRRRR
jgi:hypothetical protein